MSKLKPHRVYERDFHPEYPIATVHPASLESVRKVLDASEDDPNGRSQWMWVRLPNGDLVLGVYPQGTTYEAVEDDAFYKGD